jgi:cephalosporin-C deacetylase-like acetyl esterase
MFERYLQRRASEVTRGSLAGIQSRAEWERRRPEVRRQLLYMLGLDPMPARTPLHARTTGQFQREGYRVENVVFESMPGLYVTGNLYLPTARQGRLPAVLYVCGHSPDPAGAKVIYQRNGIWLARLGYVVLVVDPLHFGEVSGIHHGTNDLGMWYWHSLGYTPVGPEVWNAVRALDYLETRPEVTPGKFGMTGGSGGGAVTWYTAALDERVQVAVPRCATWTAEDQAARNAVLENCDCIYYPNTYLLDFPAVGALIAPRSLKILNAMRDPMFPRPGYKDVYRRARVIFDLLDAGGRIEEFEEDVPHRDTPAFRKNNFEWMNRWLKNDPAPFEEKDVAMEEPAALRVLDGRPAGAVNDSIFKTFIRTHEPRRPESLTGWKKRRAELLAELKDKVFRAFPGKQVPFAVSRTRETGWTSRFADAWNVEFTTEEGVRVGGQLFVPRSARRPMAALIHVKGAADIVYPVDYDFILPALGKHAIFVLRPRAVDYPLDNFRMATLRRTAALVGATLESMQLWDILRSVDYLIEEEKLPLDSISICGRGEMGALGFYAAALDERITRVIVDNPPASHWQGPALLNVLRVTDLPEAAALVAPRELVWLTPMPSPYSLTAHVFALHNSKEKMRQAGGLAAALQIR